KPNRLKITLGFEDKVLNASQPISTTAQVNWLHGAPARNVALEMQATLRFAGGGFASHPNYVFADPIRTFYETEIPFFTRSVNSDGFVNINKKLDISKNAPGMLKANILTKAFEGGGDFSMDVHTVRSEEHTSELQSRENLVCRLLLEKKKKQQQIAIAQYRNTHE